MSMIDLYSVDPVQVVQPLSIPTPLQGGNNLVQPYVGNGAVAVQLDLVSLEEEAEEAQLAPGFLNSLAAGYEVGRSLTTWGAGPDRNTLRLPSLWTRLQDPQVWGALLAEARAQRQLQLGHPPEGAILVLFQLGGGAQPGLMGPDGTYSTGFASGMPLANPASTMWMPSEAAEQLSASAPVGGPQPLTMSDQSLADKIDQLLKKEGSPAAGKGAGQMFVQEGRRQNIDPLLLVAIAAHETGYGKLGIGVNGMLGVGAYDDNPENAVNSPQFSGIQNQIRRGADTFAHWRDHYGAGQASVEEQVRAVGRKWATDPQWADGVLRHYERIRQEVGA